MLKKLLAGLVMFVAMVGMAIAAVNINTATPEELASLPNIGMVKAKAIVDYRKANGNFKAIEDIKNVKGIGDKTFEKIKAQLALSGATTVTAAPAKAEKKEAKVAKAAKAEASAPAAKDEKKGKK